MNKTAEFFLKYLYVFIYYILLDGTMIALYSKNAFGKMIKKIQGGKNMQTRMLPTILCFLLLAFGINYFVLPKIRKEHIVKDCLQYGAVFGLVVYGVYDLTNLGTFINFNWGTAIIDIIWGGVLGFVVSILATLSWKATEKK